MEPLKVTARLIGGYGAYDPWSPSLDAVLAYVALRRKLGHDAFYNTPTDRHGDTPDLPIARVDVGSDWVWACSWPLPAGANAADLIHTNKRFDTYYATMLCDNGRKSVVQTKTGPFKSHRTPLRIVACRAVDWHVVGERAGIEDLLSEVTFVGKKHAHGCGQVVRWVVEPEPEDMSVLHEGLLQRSVPWAEPFLAQVSPGTYYEADLGIRPPYWHRAQVRKCAVPLRG